MGRPQTPLIDKSTAVATALEIIDRDGLDALSIRRLGAELGVNGASLYHHFSDKEEIFEGVRRLVLADLRVPDARDIPWQRFVVNAAVAYREALLRHPHTAPLMVPDGHRPPGLRIRDFAAETVLRAGVPSRFVFPIIDSTETFAFGAALMNPRRLSSFDRVGQPGEGHPSLLKAVRANRTSVDNTFRRQLEAIVEGWSALIERER